jgi:hypothetical protein
MVRNFIRFSGVFAIALAVQAPGFGADDTKAAPSSPPPSDPAPLFITSGDIVGEITKVDDKSITVRVTWYTQAPAKNARNQYGNWHRGTTSRNSNQMYQHMIQMQQQMARQAARAANTKSTVHHQDYTMNFTSDAQARIKHLPPKLDESGKKTFYTSDELQKLKGNPVVPGYMAEISQLKVGQLVEAHMVHVPKQKEQLVRWALILNENQGAQNGNNSPGGKSTSQKN